MEEKKSNIRIQLLVVIAGVILLSGKFTAYFMTHSNAILTDALESIVNVVAGGIGLYSLWLSAKPRDFDHPYGHGKVEFISAGVEGTLVFLAGVFITAKSIYTIFSPQPIHDLDVGGVILFVTAIGNFLLGIICIRQGEKTDSLALVASGKHLRSDAWSTFGIVAAVLLIYVTGFAWIDIAVSAALGVFIAYTGYKVSRKAIAGIMDEADYELLGDIISRVNEHRREPWVDLHKMRVIKYGNVLHIDCHLTVPWYFTVKQAHDETDLLDQVIRTEMKNPVELFIHTDYCLPPYSCYICTMSHCEVRQAPFQKRVEWNLENAVRDRKHGINEAVTSA